MLPFEVLILVQIISANVIKVPLEPTGKYELEPDNLTPLRNETLYTMAHNTTIPLKNLSNVGSIQMQYRGKVYVGTPPQAFSLIFDTGSSVFYNQWLWVPSYECMNKCHNITNYFYPNNSSTIKLDGPSRRLKVTLMQYGKGEAHGRIGWDRVSISDIDTFYVEEQTFILVNNDSDFSGMEADGIFVRNI